MLRWTEDELEKYQRKRNTPDPTPVQVADMEPASGDGSLAKSKGSQLDKRASIRVHSKRERLADPDGISAKAIIDGLVACGVLRDDNAQCIQEVSFSQEVSKVEETIIEITWE